MRRQHRWGVLLVVAMAAAGCSSSKSTGSSASSTTRSSTAGVTTPTQGATTPAATATTPAATTPVATTSATTATTTLSASTTAATPPASTGFSSPVANPKVEGPITTGKGKAVLGPGGLDLAAQGYQEDEFFVSGTANAFDSDAPLTSDGRWTTHSVATAPYETRIVVRRPKDPAKFNGTVVVEWLNVSGGLDAGPDWTYAHVELMRTGTAWVGVSAQHIGVDGIGGSSLGASLVLKTADPERYGALAHPGDDYSYDMFSQAGIAVRSQAPAVLGGLVPRRVIAAGESQSAFRLTTYVNGIAPTAKVFDGYLIHSRAGYSSALRVKPDPAQPGSTAVISRTEASDIKIRTDLDRPVLTVSTETDLLGDRLGYRRAVQPDSPTFRSWEVAGTAHADGYNLGLGDTDDGSGKADGALFFGMRLPASSIYGGLLTCDKPINYGPETYVLRSAFAALDQWIRTSTPPPSMPPIQLNAAGDGYALDANGNVLGGIRTPQVDAAVAALSGLGQSGTGFCFLFGTTTPADPATLAARYPDHAGFMTTWTAALDRAIAAGAVLPADRAALISAADNSDVGRRP